MCSNSVFKKSKRFEVIKSDLISTQVFTNQNKLEGEFRAARIHDQNISWGDCVDTSPLTPFSNLTVSASCTCKYHLKITQDISGNKLKYCSHIIGQLRRVIFMTK